MCLLKQFWLGSEVGLGFLWADSDRVYSGNKKG